MDCLTLQWAGFSEVMELQGTVASYRPPAEQWAWQDSTGCCMSQTGPSSLTCGSQTSDYLTVTHPFKSQTSSCHKMLITSYFKCATVFLDSGDKNKQGMSCTIPWHVALCFCLNATKLILQKIFDVWNWSLFFSDQNNVLYYILHCKNWDWG